MAILWDMARRVAYRVVLIATAAGLSGGFIGPAAAGELVASSTEIAPPPLFEIRYIKEGDPAATTSKCIGNPITPLCAVDTMQADSLYVKDNLRDVALGKIPGTTNLTTAPPYDPALLCYQIVGYWIYQPEDWAYRVHNFLRPGDVAVNIRWGVEVHGHVAAPFVRECDLSPTGHPFLSYLLRKGDFGWYIYAHHHRIDFIRSPEPYRGMGK